MQQRIDRLESLVKKLVAQGQETPPLDDSPKPSGSVKSRDEAGSDNRFGSTGSPIDTLAAPYIAGTTVVDERHSVYKAATDWSEVLHEVRSACL
jgi:hypothetical protein